MIESDRKKLDDKIFDEDLENDKYHNYLFVRVGAKGKRFVGVDFSHTYFEHCYFRNCIFDSCNFNGCKFINTNLLGSSFPGSKFEYAIFDKTQVDNDILKSNCPGLYNQKQKFARSLRTNYQSLGDAASVNKAIKIELEATKIHLKKAWHSNESYYRKKYSGLQRVEEFFKWFVFVIQEFIWGNGEKPWKLFRTGLLLWIMMTITDVVIFHNPMIVSDYFAAFLEMPKLFLGVGILHQYSGIYLSLITAIRLIGFGLFLSILIKRFNKR